MKSVVKQGDDHPILIPVMEGIVPVDVTGWTGTAQVYESRLRLLHTWSTNDGSAICGVNGVSLLTDDSIDWTWNYGHFDVVVISPDTSHRVPAEGIIEVKRLWTM